MTLGWVRRLSWAIALLLALSTAAFGQQVLRGSIAGTVRDDTGGALPGITVTVTSPALQVPSIVRISGTEGEYLIPDLTAGTYRVMYELPGFATLVREGIILTTGFAARVDVTMKVATLAETVTVSGETPIVDVSSTRGGATLSKDLMTSLPTSMNFKDLLLASGGILNTGPPLIGQVNTGASGFSGKSYGGAAGTAVLEGVKMNPNESPDFTAYEEVDVRTFGNTADVDIPGAAVQLVVKSGGNQFHGTYNTTYQNKRTQSNNIDQRLIAQGLSGAGTGLNYFTDTSGDIGGRIVRDKLWFYAGTRFYANEETRLGFAADRGPDGVYGTSDDPPAKPHSSHFSLTYKVSWQATPKNRFISVRQQNDDYTGPAGTRFMPLESTFQLNQYMGEMKPLEWQSTLSSRWLLSTMWGFGGYNAARYYPEQYLPGGPRHGDPSRYDLATQMLTGPAFTQRSASTSPSVLRQNKLTRNQFSGNVNYASPSGFLGSHAIQAGYRVWVGQQLYANPNEPELHCDSPTGPCVGEYELIYDTVGGVPHQPFQLEVHNTPVSGASKQRSYALYLMDGWRPTDRLTVNLGVRWERQTHYVPPQVKVQGTFGSSGTFPKVDVGSWNALAPRAGVAFDLSGNGKTVFKATYGWFNVDLGINGFAGLFNQNSITTIVYRWSDSTRCDCYVPGTVNLNTNGPDFVSISGATNNVINPELRLPYTHEATAAIEQDLGSSLSIRGLYVYKRDVDAFNSTNTNYNLLRPAGLYNLAFNRQDPGPDGVIRTADDGATLTIYDYAAAYRGSAFQSDTHRNADAGLYDSFNNFEVMLTKRQTGKWFANTSVLATKNHRYLKNVIQSPNDLLFNLDETWDVSYRLAAGYSLPYGINVSTLYQAYSGVPYQRTNIFRAADPAGGPAFPGQATITLPVEEFGLNKGPNRHLVNLRFQKEFRFGSSSLKAGVDAFNAFNSNVAWGGGTNGSGINGASGPTYGTTAGIVQPRMLRFNLGYTF